MLATGAILALKRDAAGRHWLSVGWAFTFGIAWTSLAANIECGVDPARDGRVNGFHIALVGLLVASSFSGLGLSLLSRDPD